MKVIEVVVGDPSVDSFDFNFCWGKHTQRHTYNIQKSYTDILYILQVRTYIYQSIVFNQLGKAARPVAF